MGSRCPEPKLRASDVALGLIVRLARSPASRATGHDFLFLDGAHALLSVETRGEIAQTALGCGVTPIVRARSVTIQMSRACSTTLPV